MSSAVLRHRGRDNLTRFFATTAQSRITAVAHVDVTPGLWADVGAWVLHQTRMCEPISRHNGNLSMRRTFTTSDLWDHSTAGTAANDHLHCDSVTNLYPCPEPIVRPFMGLRADRGPMP